MKTPPTLSLSIIATTYIFSHIVGLLVSFISSPQLGSTILCGIDIEAKMMLALCSFLSAVLIPFIQSRKEQKKAKEEAAEEERQRLAADEAALRAEEERIREEERRQSLCPQCGGSGQTEYGQICPACNGSGIRMIEVCPTCSGRGINAAGCACPRCGGRGQFYLN